VARSVLPSPLKSAATALCGKIATSYMRSGQNVDAAARELFVHPNTLRHRLTRFEETTGASLRDLESLAEIWWALTRAELERA